MLRIPPLRHFALRQHTSARNRCFEQIIFTGHGELSILVRYQTICQSLCYWKINMHLSKSDFKVARTCGTKLYYKKLRYPSK